MNRPPYIFCCTQVVTRGRYMAPGTPFTDVDKPLHLHITPGACSTEVSRIACLLLPFAFQYLPVHLGYCICLIWSSCERDKWTS